MFRRATPPPTPAELRAAAEEARERRLAAAPLRVPPPSAGTAVDPATVVDAGCLLCGLDAVEVPGGARMDGVAVVPAPSANPDPSGRRGQQVGQASTYAVERGALRAIDVPRERLAVEVWSRVSVSPRTIGGSGGRMVTGWLCPSCADATVDEDTLGVAAISAALGLDAGVEVARLRGVTFGARVLAARRRGVPEPSPGRVRWAGVAVDLSELEAPTVERAVEGEVEVEVSEVRS